MAFLGISTMIPPGIKSYDIAFILYSYPNLLLGAIWCHFRSATAVFWLAGFFLQANFTYYRVLRGQSDERNDLVLVKVSSFSNRDYVHKWRGNMPFFGLQTSGWVVDPNVLLILQSKSKSPGAPLVQWKL